MILSSFSSKNYIHVKDSLFYSECSITLTFLFIAIMSAFIILYGRLIDVNLSENNTKKRKSDYSFDLHSKQKTNLKKNF